MSTETKYVFTCNVCGKKEDHIERKVDGWYKVYYKIVPLGDNYFGASTEDFDICNSCCIHYKIIERDGVIKSVINFIMGTK